MVYSCHMCASLALEIFACSVVPFLSYANAIAAIRFIACAGFCAISCEFPISDEKAVTEVEVAGVHRNGMNAPINKAVHCLAAEPHATFLRVSIADGGQEVAYESAVLGRLRSGYRILHLRSTFGTRIELCYLFVKISISSTLNLHAGPRMQERQFREMRQRIFDLENQRNSCAV